VSNDDEWKLPKRREVTDLEGKPALPPLPGAPTSFGPAAQDQSPLELDRHAEPEPTPPQRRLPIVPVVAVLVLAAAGFFGWKALAHHMKTNGEIELVHVPPGAKLLLDGTPIEGTHLVLQRSKERHAVTVLQPGMPPKIVRFTVDENTTLDLAR
jgi:hypothetical protein